MIGFWIGGKDEHTTYFPGTNLPDQPDNGYLGGQWKWTNGKPWNFINWDDGQPINQGDDDCIMIRSDTAKWEDFDCSIRSFFFNSVINFSEVRLVNYMNLLIKLPK